MYKILAINPGSTSTKIAVFDDTVEVYNSTIRHSAEELQNFEKITDQFSFRKGIILNELCNTGINIYDINIVVGRGGLVKPIPSGVYEVNEELKKDLLDCRLGEHASNLGGLIAVDIAEDINKHYGNNTVRAVIVDPVVVDELQDVARISGHPLFQRISIFHALNQKAIGREYAKKIGKKYEDLNLIIAHLGGGISIGAHKRGKVIDVNNALDGEGPFSPERSGTLPTGQLSKLCFSGNYTHKNVKEMLTGKGGLVAYLGTNSAYDVEIRAKDGDAKASLIQDAMAYQIAKEIGAMASVLCGNVDAILITGGIAYNKDLVKYITEMTSFIANISVFPGEDEMAALANNAFMVYTGELEIQKY